MILEWHSSRISTKLSDNSLTTSREPPWMQYCLLSPPASPSARPTPSWSCPPALSCLDDKQNSDTSTLQSRSTTLRWSLKHYFYSLFAIVFLHFVMIPSETIGSASWTVLMTRPLNLRSCWIFSRITSKISVGWVMNGPQPQHALLRVLKPVEWWSYMNLNNEV